MGVAAHMFCCEHQHYEEAKIAQRIDRYAFEAKNRSDRCVREDSDRRVLTLSFHHASLSATGKPDPLLPQVSDPRFQKNALNEKLVKATWKYYLQDGENLPPD
jgi:hypothetical protein